MSDDLQNEISFLGIESSPAFTREPEVNGVAERLFESLSEQILRPCDFHSLPESRETLDPSRNHHDRPWGIERPGFQAPNQARWRLAL